MVVALFALMSSGCGSTATTTTTTSAEGASAVTVALTSPTSGSVIAADQVIVRGTVSPANAVVQVQGQPATVGNGVFTGTATLHGGKTTIDVIGSAPGAAPDSTSIMVDRQSAGGTAATPRPASAAVTPAIAYSGNGSGETACGNDLAVGPDTTCSFAENVRSAYDGTGPGTVMAYSPVTDRTYAMSCSAGAAVVCTGANNASVYFPGNSASTAYGTTHPSSSEATPTVAHASGHTGETACGDDLSVGADTTCAFAENVRSAYEGTGPGTVMAYSPVTNRTYTMTCSAGAPVVCTGAHNASVYFS
jgi:Glucodextranase, domain B